MESRIQAFEYLWCNRLPRPQLSRTEEYDDYSMLVIPDPSWLARTTGTAYKLMYKEPEISDEAYWAGVFGENWSKNPDPLDTC